MSTKTGIDPDAVERALSWVSTRGVETRTWTGPSHDAPVDPPDHPILYLVDPGIEAPMCSELEDWIRRPIEIDELNARTDRLVARSRRQGTSYTRVDDDGILRVGDEVIVLSDSEARLMRALIADLGSLVRREDLAELVWPDGPPSDPRALDNRVKSLRKRLHGVPLRIHTVRARGLLLERLPS